MDIGDIFQAEDSAYIGLVRDGANRLHWRTKPAVVRRELLFAEGEACDEARLAETARLLRAQPYVRSAILTPSATGDGGVIVHVATRDEWTTRVGVRVASSRPFPVPRLRWQEENLLGEGLGVEAAYDLLGRRPAYLLEAVHHQFLHRRWDARLTLGRTVVGPVADQVVLRPFRSEFDRVAWRAAARYREEPFELVGDSAGTIVQPILAAGAEVGTAVRFGRPGALRLLGVALSAERLSAHGAPFASQPYLDSAAGAALAGRFGERRRVRLTLFAGARSLSFHPHRGLDAVNGVDDVREGLEAGLVVARSVFGLKGLDRDDFVAAEIFLGRDLDERTLVAFRAKAEGRRLWARRRWDGVLLDAELLIYTGLERRGRWVLGLAGTGGWRTSAPFQLFLAGANGIRGYGEPAIPAGSRVVLRGEHRYFLGTVFGAVDLGSAAFVDLGRGWAGDVPFGRTTELLGAVGGGIRVAAPRGSRVTYRADVAVPLAHGRGVELRITVGQQFGLRRGEPEDVARSRERTSSVTVFNFPRF